MKQLLSIITLSLLSSCWFCPDSSQPEGRIYLENRGQNMQVFIYSNNGLNSLDTLELIGNEFGFSFPDQQYIVVMTDSVLNRSQSDTISDFNLIQTGKCDAYRSIISCSLNGEIVRSNEVIISY